MSDSQVWSDVVAMALALRSDEDTDETYIPILRKYTVLKDGGEMAVDIKLVTAMMTILSTLVDATAEHLDMTSEELGHFLLMEKYKRDLFEDNDGPS